MTTFEIEGNGNVHKGKLKQKWARRMSDYFQFVEGKQDELIGRIQKRGSETMNSIPDNPRAE
jgi:uncharacterized protein YjbJ (UPF0337 family)